MKSNCADAELDVRMEERISVGRGWFDFLLSVVMIGEGAQNSNEELLKMSLSQPSRKSFNLKRRLSSKRKESKENLERGRFDY